MNTFVQKGHRLKYTAGANIVSGELLILRSGASGICAIAVTDIANGSDGEVEISGVHQLTAETGVWTQGQLLYRHASNKTLTSASTGNTLAGYAAAPKATAATTGYVVLNGNPGN